MSFDPSKGPRPVRVEVPMDGELFLRLEDARGDVPRAAFMRRALEKALGVLNSPEVAKARAVLESRPDVRSGPPPRVVESSPASAVFKCPVGSCGFRAKSPAARCPDHGRTVVPA